MEKVDEEKQRKRESPGEVSGGQNGDGVEDGVRQDKPNVEQAGEAEGLAAEAQDFDVEDIEGWLGGSSSGANGGGLSVCDEIARLFGEVSCGGAGLGLSGGEVLDFWDGEDGQGICAVGGGLSGGAECKDGCRVFGGEEIRTVFGEEEVPNGKSIQLLGVGDHLVKFGEAAPEDGNQIFRGEECQDGYVGKSSQIDDKNMNLASCEHSSGNNARVFINEEAGDRIVGGPAGNVGVMIDIHGGYREGRRGNGGEEVVVMSTGKRGRPKGSKNKRKTAVAVKSTGRLLGVASDSIGVVKPKGKRGRPKGSKNKQKKIAFHEHGGTPVVGTIAPSGGSEIAEAKRDLAGVQMAKEFVGTGAVSGKVVGPNVLGEDMGPKVEVLPTTRTRGRPKGSRNKKKNKVSDGSENGSQLVCTKPKIGGPKGSKNKKKHLADPESRGLVNVNVVEINSNIVTGWWTELEDGRTKLLGGGASETPGESTCKNEGENMSFQSKGSRGRPKGSKNKKKNPAVKETKSMTLETGRSALIDEGSSGIPAEAFGGDEFRNAIIQPENKHKRLKTSKANLAVEETRGLPGKTVWPTALKDEGPTLVVEKDEEKPAKASGGGGGGNDGQRKVGRGRPKGSKNRRLAIAVREYKSQGGEKVGASDGGCNRSTNKPGLPRGSKNKKRILLPGALGKILALKHQHLTTLSTLEDQNVKDFKTMDFPHEQFRNMEKTEIKSNELISGSTNFQKRPRGRPKTLNKQKTNPSFTGQGNSTETLVSYLKSIFSHSPD